MRNDWLNAYKKDKVHSQFGEDGILLKALELLPARDGWCVEFGAWDGLYLSATLALRERGSRAVLIEGDPAKFAELERNVSREPGAVPVRAFVEATGPSSLDEVLARTPIPRDFDVLVVDIDGDDYHVWKGLTRYRPKLVCIECNPTFPDDAVFVQQPGQRNQGSSMSTTVLLGKEKGYELVATLGGNLFLVDGRYFPAFGIEDNSLHALREWYGSITHVAHTYRGEVLVYGPKRLIWDQHGLVNEELAKLEAVCNRLPALSGRRARAYRLLTRLRDRLLGL